MPDYGYPLPAVLISGSLIASTVIGGTITSAVIGSSDALVQISSFVNISGIASGTVKVNTRYVDENGTGQTFNGQSITASGPTSPNISCVRAHALSTIYSTLGQNFATATIDAYVAFVQVA